MNAEIKRINNEESGNFSQASDGFVPGSKVQAEFQNVKAWSKDPRFAAFLIGTFGLTYTPQAGALEISNGKLYFTDENDVRHEAGGGTYTLPIPLILEGDQADATLQVDNKTKDANGFSLIQKMSNSDTGYEVEFWLDADNLGDPNGLLTAPTGSMCWSGNILWFNFDGGSTWIDMTNVGGQVTVPSVELNTIYENCMGARFSRTGANTTWAQDALGAKNTPNYYGGVITAEIGHFLSDTVYNDKPFFSNSYQFNGLMLAESNITFYEIYQGIGSNGIMTNHLWGNPTDSSNHIGFVVQCIRNPGVGYQILVFLTFGNGTSGYTYLLRTFNVLAGFAHFFEGNVNYYDQSNFTGGTAAEFRFRLRYQSANTGLETDTDWIEFIVNDNTKPWPFKTLSSNYEVSDGLAWSRICRYSADANNDYTFKAVHFRYEKADYLKKLA